MMNAMTEQANRLSALLNYKINVHNETNRSSRCAGHTSHGHRHIKTASNSVEAYLKWSLTREMLRANASSFFIIFTVIPEAVHVTLSQAFEERIENHQWIFSPETRLEDVIAELESKLNGAMRCYLFLPSRSSLRELPENHLGNSLNRDMLKQFYPYASVIRTDCFARVAHHVTPRIIGADTRHWLGQLVKSACGGTHDICADEFLASASRMDSAMIMKLMRNA